MTKYAVKLSTGDVMTIAQANAWLGGRTTISARTPEPSMRYWGLSWLKLVPRPSLAHEMGLQADDDGNGNWYQVWSKSDSYYDTKIQEAADAVRRDAAVSYDDAVTISDGTVWNGGFDSASRIKGVIDLVEWGLPFKAKKMLLAVNPAATVEELEATAAQALASATVTLGDYQNNPHVMTLDEGRLVALEIGEDYQLKFWVKQQALKAVLAIDPTAANVEYQIATKTYAAYLEQAIAAKAAQS